MLEKIFDTLVFLYFLIDMVAEITVTIVVTLVVSGLLLALIFIAFEFSTLAGIIMLIVCLSYVRVLMR